VQAIVENLDEIVEVNKEGMDCDVACGWGMVRATVHPKSSMEITIGTNEKGDISILFDIDQGICERYLTQQTYGKLRQILPNTAAQMGCSYTGKDPLLDAWLKADLEKMVRMVREHYPTLFRWNIWRKTNVV
jgi:hypothetical protein